MSGESLRIKPEETEDDGGQSRPSERVPTGPFADTQEEAAQSSADAKMLLEELAAPRNPDEEVQVASLRETVGEKLEQVTALIEKEKRKNESLSTVRQDLGVPHEQADTLRTLEKARETLEEEQRHIELASEYNDVLDSFSDLSSEEVEHIARTGKTKKGESIHNKYGKQIHSDLAKELAHMHSQGGRRVTWREIRELGKVVDRILHDVVSVVKGIFKGTGGGEEKSRAE